MANRANLRIWTRDFSEATMIPEFARFLTTAPLSASQTAFTELHVQPVDSTETTVAQWDLRDQGYGPPEVAALAAQQLNVRSSAANYPPKEKKISRLGWTPSSHGGNLGFRRTPKRHLITKAT